MNPKVMTFAATTATVFTLAFSQSVVARDVDVKLSSNYISQWPGTNFIGVHAPFWGIQKEMDEDGPIPSGLSDWLKEAGPILRHAGSPNEISWRACVGPKASRPKVYVVPWFKEMKCGIGIDEQIALSDLTNSNKYWFIANLVKGKQHKTDDADTGSEAASWAQYVREKKPKGEVWWELGNELWAGEHHWGPERYAKRASVVAKQIISADPSAKILLPLVEFNVPGAPKRNEYNKRALESYTGQLDGVALHLYYEGKPGGPSIATQLRTVKEVADLLKERHKKTIPIWITEHGRWPRGESSDKNWKYNWYLTNDIDGVLATANFIGELTQKPEVQGAMVHALRAGPWATMGAKLSKPTGMGHLLTALKATQPGRAVKLREEGGDDELKVYAFESSKPNSFGVWLINRDTSASTFTITHPKYKKWAAALANNVGCSDGEKDCRTEDISVAKNSSAKAEGTGLSVKAPPKSVTTLLITGEP